MAWSGKQIKTPDKDLNGEPGVTDALNVEEGVVSIGAVLVQRPVGHISSSRAHSDIPGEKMIMGTFMTWAFTLS